ncbi:MAG: CPBP family intramembrane metalloprotease [Deltaproteobacteria bacterium]|jgi:membrane protease YdiL (CAAX protease family)|nr:CPBP family intramembrane metalloprotease [Deltaproteobacteria bacterium]
MERYILALCVVAFCVAMGLRETVNIWLGTGTAALVAIALLRLGCNANALSLRAVSRSGAALGLAVGVAMSIATWVLYPISAELVPAIQAEVTKLYALLRQPPGPVWAFPVLVLVVAAEELVWRGLAIDVLGKTGKMLRPVLLSSLIYMLPQVAFRSPLLVLVAFVCGMVWGLLRVRTGGLAAPLVAHLVWDILVFVLFPVA